MMLLMYLVSGRLALRATGRFWVFAILWVLGLRACRVLGLWGLGLRSWVGASVYACLRSGA
jgi:hypothetical protein